MKRANFNNLITGNNELTQAASIIIVVVKTAVGTLSPSIVRLTWALSILIVTLCLLIGCTTDITCTSYQVNVQNIPEVRYDNYFDLSFCVFAMLSQY